MAIYPNRVRIYIPLVEHLQSLSPPFIHKLSNGLFIFPISLLLTCVYISVVFELLCPNTSWIYRRSVPHSSRCVAKLCLRECTVTSFSMFAFLQAFEKSNVLFCRDCKKVWCWHNDNGTRMTRIWTDLHRFFEWIYAAYQKTMVTLLLFKQHRLYFIPEPRGHGSFLPIFFDILLASVVSKSTTPPDLIESLIL